MFKGFWKDANYCFGTDENGDWCLPGFPGLKFEMPTIHFDASYFTEGPRIRVLCLVPFVAIPVAEIPFTLFANALCKGPKGIRI